MNNVEKRELFEQERKVFEAGAQRVERRTGSFSFLTWPFFIAIAQLLASEGFLAATFNSASAEEAGAKAAPAGAALQPAHDDPPVSDPAKPGAEDGTARGLAASSDAHAAPLDPAAFLAQPHDDAPKPSTAPDHDVAGTTAPVEAAQPALTTATDAADPTLLADGTDAAAPVVGQVLSLDVPVSTVPAHMDYQSAALDMAGGLTDPAVASAMPVVDAADPLLATMTGAASQSTTLLQTAASDGAVAYTLGSSAPALDVAELTSATAGGAAGDLAQEGQDGNLASHAVANAASVLDATEPALAPMAGDSLPNAAPVVDATEPVLATTAAAPSLTSSDVSYPADLADAGNGASHALSSAEPDTGQAAGPADTLLALATAADAPIESPGSPTAAQAEVATDASNAAAAVQPTAVAGDVIALNDAPPPPANALFTGNQYTPYGVTLSSDVAASPQHAPSPADAASAHDTPVPAVADAQTHAPPPPDIVDTTHPIDHLGHAIL